MPELKNWVVTLGDGEDWSAVADAIADAGLEIETRLDAIGVITGKGAPDIADRLRALSGVSDVAEDRPIDIGRPDSPVGW